MLVAVTMVKGRSGFERDGSYSTQKKETAGRCLTQELPVRVSVLQRMKPDLEQSSWELFDEDGIRNLLNIPEEQELAALIAVGYPDISRNHRRERLFLNY